MKENKTIWVTGGAGFIGSHVIRHFLKKYTYNIVNVDALTYAGNLSNLKDIEHYSNYHFAHVDITDQGAIQSVIERHPPDWIIHLAAESHV
ncbi:MAG: GDP-mannose 4,6-dehydratase, partial [Saprospiraceae bacterium]|nr:GDP-mannose 4,6-dehydratase [Saprospiraceae bacterium]